MSERPDSVVLILIDAMRPDGLQVSSSPIMDGLIETGCSTLGARSIMPSITLPCITSLFHSSTPEIHGVSSNKWTPSFSLPPSLFSVIRSKERKTGSFCNWEELRDLGPVGSLDAAVFMDNSYDSGGIGDRCIAELAADMIRREFFTFAFVYLGHVDVVGHEYGYMSDEYISAISAADASVGIVMEALPSHAVTIIVADHGGHDNGHGSGADEDMAIPLIVNGPGIPGGRTIEEDVSLLDIAPTIAELLGIERPENWMGEPIGFGDLKPTARRG